MTWTCCQKHYGSWLTAILDAEVSAQIVAQYGERSPELVTYRNLLAQPFALGYPAVGSMALHIPKLRSTPASSPSLLEPRRRSAKALLAIIQVALCRRRVHPEGGRSALKALSRLATSSPAAEMPNRICEQLDEVMERFLGPASGRWSLPLRVAGRPDPAGSAGAFATSTSGWSVTTCPSMPTGRVIILGMDVGASEDGAFWLAFMRSLTARGLSRGNWSW